MYIIVIAAIIIGCLCLISSLMAGAILYHALHNGLAKPPSKDEPHIPWLEDEDDDVEGHKFQKTGDDQKVPRYKLADEGVGSNAEAGGEDGTKNPWDRTQAALERHRQDKMAKPLGQQNGHETDDDMDDDRGNPTKKNKPMWPTHGDPTLGWPKVQGAARRTGGGSREAAGGEGRKKVNPWNRTQAALERHRQDKMAKPLGQQNGHDTDDDTDDDRGEPPKKKEANGGVYSGHPDSEFIPLDSAEFATQTNYMAAAMNGRIGGG